IHCTITRQMASRISSFREFLSFWSDKQEIRQIWFSFFTPQVGSHAQEIVPPRLKERVLGELQRLRSSFPKLYLPDRLIRSYRNPPASPEECIFARTTACFSSDLATPVSPCQLGGNPDCAQCGCMASAGLKALADYRLLGALPLRTLYEGSDRIGKLLARRSAERS
ncbi:MAG: radical SAM protein, partial [Acidobacteriota bacterium]